MRSRPQPDPPQSGDRAQARRPDPARDRRAGIKARRTRTVPLHAQEHEALRGRYVARPAAATDALFVSLRIRQSAVAEAISAGAVGDVVAKHAAAAGVRENRRTAHALRHTFCTMLSERGVALEVISALAGPVDVRTTQIYVDVSEQRKAGGISALEHILIRWRRSPSERSDGRRRRRHSSILAANDRTDYAYRVYGRSCSTAADRITADKWLSSAMFLAVGAPYGVREARGEPLNPTDRAIAAMCLVLPRGRKASVMAPPRRR